MVTRPIKATDQGRIHAQLSKQIAGVENVKQDLIFMCICWDTFSVGLFSIHDYLTRGDCHGSDLNY